MFTSICRYRIISNHSCETQLLTTDDFAKAIDHSPQIDAVIVNLAKAFDNYISPQTRSLWNKRLAKLIVSRKLRLKVHIQILVRCATRVHAETNPFSPIHK